MSHHSHEVAGRFDSVRIDAEWKLVTIDDFLPCRVRPWYQPKARTLYAGISGGQVYPSLLEKAFAKFTGSYEAWWNRAALGQGLELLDSMFSVGLISLLSRYVEIDVSLHVESALASLARRSCRVAFRSWLGWL